MHTLKTNVKKYKKSKGFPAGDGFRFFAYTKDSQ